MTSRAASSRSSRRARCATACRAAWSPATRRRWRYNDNYAFKLIQILKRAGVTIVANPLDNIVLQGRFDTYPKRRGMTRVKELDAAGINVACGHDSIMDPWYPLGRGSMLDALSMLVHVAQMTGRNELFRAYEMVTTNPARAAEVPWGVKEGLPANFVIFDCSDEAEAIRLRPAARWVVRAGAGRGRDGAGPQRRPSGRRVRGRDVQSPPAERDGRSETRDWARAAARTMWKELNSPDGDRHDAPRGDAHPRGRHLDRGPRDRADPGVRPLRVGQPGVHGLVHAQPRAGRVLHRAARAARLPAGRVRDRPARDHRRQPASARRLVGLLATMGPETGMAQMPLSRLPYGKSIVLPGLLNWLSCIGWDGINSVFGAAALSILTGARVLVALVIIVLCQAALGIIGHEAIHTFEKWMAIVLGIMFAILTVAIVGEASTGSRGPTGSPASTSSARSSCTRRSRQLRGGLGACTPPTTRATWRRTRPLEDLLVDGARA